MEMAPNLPGLTFHVLDRQLRGPSAPDHSAIGTISLTATVVDLAIWDAVVQKLDGMVIYTVSDIAATLVDYAKRRADQADKARVDAVEAARSEVENLRFALAMRDQLLSSAQARVNELTLEVNAANEYMRLAGILP